MANLLRPLQWRLPLALLLISSLAHFSIAARAASAAQSYSSIKAVNLGGWLVTEGWIKPSLFDGIVKKHFLLWRITSTSFLFRVVNNQFFGLSNRRGNTDVLVATSTDPNQSDTFDIVVNSNDRSRVRIKAKNGMYLQAKTDVLVTADYPENTSWGDDDPSVFLMTTVAKLRGEFQVTNGYGPEKAKQTVAVIDFLASKYGRRRGLLAIELINEPLAPKATLHSLKKYYQDGYNAVRKYPTTAYVIMSNRLSEDSTELLQFAGKLRRCVLDVHYYNLYSSYFKGLTPQQNIDFVNNNRSADLSKVTVANGPRVFVGEWTAEWEVIGATKEDYQRFAQAQLAVYGKATSGWSYWTWTLKNVSQHWSLEWMINNGYISF